MVSWVGFLRICHMNPSYLTPCPILRPVPTSLHIRLHFVSRFALLYWKNINMLHWHGGSHSEQLLTEGSRLCTQKTSIRVWMQEQDSCILRRVPMGTSWYIKRLSSLLWKLTGGLSWIRFYYKDERSLGVSPTGTSGKCETPHVLQPHCHFGSLDQRVVSSWDRGEVSRI